MRRRLGVAIIASAVLIYGAWWWLLRSEWLREQLRVRTVEEIERASGGKVELGRLDFDPSLLSATIDRFVLHGTEGAGAAPLVRAERIQIGLKIVSFLRGDVDVGRIEIMNPKVNVIVDAEGRTNLPSPAKARRDPARGPVEDVLRLAADAFVIVNGEFSYDAKKYRFSARGRDVRAQFDYDAKGPVYRGAVSSNALEVDAANLPRLNVDASATLVVAKDSVEFSALRLQSGPSTITGKGRIENFQSAHGRFELAVQTDLTESARLFRAPAGRGTVSSTGIFEWLGGTEIRYVGEMRANALDVNIAGVGLRPVSVTARVTATEKDLALRDVRARAAEGTFSGSAALPGYSGYQVDGAVEGLALRTLLERSGNKLIGYEGVISGPLRLQGTWAGAMVADADLRIAPREGGIPVEGHVALRYDKTAKAIVLRDSYITTPHSRLDIAGTLMQTLRVKFAASSLDELGPALALAGQTQPLPVRMESNGSVLFDGTVSGAIQSPLVAGELRAARTRWRGVMIESLNATLLASEEKLTLTRFHVAQGGATLNGSGTVALRNWKAGGGSTVDLRVDGRSLNVADLRDLAGSQEPLDGLVNARAHIAGTVDDPRGELEINWFRPGYAGEHFDRIRATLEHARNTLRVKDFEAVRGPARLVGSGTFQHAPGGWRNGTATGSFQLTGLELGTIPAVQSLREGTHGLATASGTFQARIVNSEVRLSAIDGESRLANVEIENRPYGELALKASTNSTGVVRVDARGSLRGSAVTATSQWRLEKDYPGTAHLDFGEVPFAILNELRPKRVAAEPWPFSGAFRGSVDFSGPALDLERWKVEVVLQDIFARPVRRQAFAGKTTAVDFELRNDGPIRLSAEGRTVSIRSARFVAKDTNISASGTFSLAEKRPWDLRMNGVLNLAGLRIFSPDILASGVATLQANVRGELASPQVFGSLELKNATLNVEGVPNGLDKVTGRVLFDRRRATIENRLTAESGGGALALSGFLDFSSDATFYRLQADAARVRIRYPEGVSTVADANIILSGTTERSLLAGTVTVVRSGFTPRTDFGRLLAESSRGESTPKEANRFLANMQIDVKVRTGPDTQFTTSLTQDLQAMANLQIRGTGARPIALGRVTISQGEINFFGNKYTIKRGEISFYNPTKVEPTLDLDLETRVRGVDVTINFTGPIDKLNVSYRSDPPLQPSEIIALLTVGRSPTESTVGSSQSLARGSFLESGANSLLGSAISAPISSQLQRFFGVSRIKIDPTIAGLEGTPQARVTVEQQVSKDVTMTFVTNLNRSQQQVVRLEWNLNKEWSMIVLRDENGSFGVDFQVRKQLK